ncbi:MAG: S8 family peptidase, partial [Nitrososphaerales archaeon]
MLLVRALALSIASILLFSVLTYSEVYSSEEEYVDVLIGFTEEADESEIIQEGGDVKYDFTSIDAIAASVPEDLIDELVLDPNITFIEYDAPVYALGHTSSIAEYSNSWGVDHIQADKVHADGNKGSGVSICILDTGIDYNHPDLAANYGEGKDFINNDNDPKDDNGHGSHVAGIAAAVLNGAGVVGVAPEAHLIIGKVLGSAGSGNISDVIAGIEWCVDNDAQIISMSLGSPIGSVAWKAALDAAYSDGVLLVAAAGNSGKCDGTGSNVVYPAKYPSVIAVTATTEENGRLISFFCPAPIPQLDSGSSTGPQVELSAPGDNIRSAWLNGAFRTLDGTSMATAHVSGAAALAWLTDETIWAFQGYTNGDGVWSNGEIRT